MPAVQDGVRALLHSTPWYKLDSVRARDHLVTAKKAALSDCVTTRAATLRWRPAGVNVVYDMSRRVSGAKPVHPQAIAQRRRAGRKQLAATQRQVSQRRLILLLFHTCVSAYTTCVTLTVTLTVPYLFGTPFHPPCWSRVQTIRNDISCIYMLHYLHQDFQGKIFCPHVDSLNCIATAFHKHRRKKQAPAFRRTATADATPTLCQGRRLSLRSTAFAPTSFNVRQTLCAPAVRKKLHQLNTCVKPASMSACWGREGTLGWRGTKR